MLGDGLLPAGEVESDDDAAVGGVDRRLRDLCDRSLAAQRGEDEPDVDVVGTYAALGGGHRGVQGDGVSVEFGHETQLGVDDAVAAQLIDGPFRRRLDVALTAGAGGVEMIVEDDLRECRDLLAGDLLVNGTDIRRVVHAGHSSTRTSM